MKKTMSFVKVFMSFLALTFATTMMAQQAELDNYRPNDKTSVNVFEAPKDVETSFDGIKVRIGGDFTQQFQALNHENKSNPLPYTDANGKEYNLNKLYPINSGFNLATANLNLDIGIADGINVKLENYMSSRHHSEFWVKGGYIQIDKLPMWENTSWFDDFVRVKIGHMEVNYGDQHFRRTDNANALQNPFVGNYIMDAFATEIGGEAYIFPTENLMIMVGATAGLIKGDIEVYDEKKPSILAKVAYDKQVNEDLRFRLSGSVYNNSGTPRNTLYGGDRAGSRFYMAMEPEYALGRSGFSKSSYSSNAFSGRYNPGFSNEITAVQFNPFVKFKGLEFFGTYEMAKGQASAEAEARDFNQFAGEVIYRFFADESVFIGGRYNQVKGMERGATADITIDRFELAAGWFVTKNILAKVEYIKQNYKDFSPDDLFYEGQFDGVMVEAVIGF